jgi:Phasin protein
LILSRDNVEGMARASQAMLKGTSELGSVWASFWNEQVTTGVEAMRSLTERHSWDEALTVQNEFARRSLERVCSQAVKSAEVTAEMFTSSLVPLQECSRKAAERMRRGGVAVTEGGRPRLTAGCLFSGGRLRSGAICCGAVQAKTIADEEGGLRLGRRPERSL